MSVIVEIVRKPFEKIIVNLRIKKRARLAPLLPPGGRNIQRRRAENNRKDEGRKRREEVLKRSTVAESESLGERLMKIVLVLSPFTRTLRKCEKDEWTSELRGKSLIQHLLNETHKRNSYANTRAVVPVRDCRSSRRRVQEIEVSLNNAE